MAFTRGLVVTSVDGSGAGSFTQATAAFVMTAGRVAVVAIRWEGDDGTVLVADTALNTWVARTKANDPTNHMNVQLFYVLSATGNATNVLTATFSLNTAAYRSVTVMQYIPGGTATFVASPANASGTSAGPVTASFTAGNLAVGQIAEFAGTSNTATSPYADTSEQPSVGSHCFDRIDNPGGSITAGGTLGTSTAWIITAASFSDGAAGVSPLNKVMQYLY